ncbi:hypothetical protein JYU34_018007 [Plutella xylostella]|uniref:DNA-dependent protein kinase catalytic subunit CC3 domain-containing protein n=1 Tax=Plutella xylostella TaxID=51655 RepID=A0ABQ7PZH8_PLUXY|nr:hypothetical protein JYU34_018007 [Plutella xylostella]
MQYRHNPTYAIQTAQCSDNISYASTLPVLRSSLTAHAPAVSALLRGVAGAPPALLPLLPALPLAAPLPAWLSTALHACAASIATHAGTLHAVRDLCTRDARTDMFDALLLPVVRYSPTKACEDFFCETMNSILSDLWPRSKSSNNFIQYAKAFALAQLAFEKLPLSTLQSPTSPLYANLDLRGSKSLAAAICKICKTLRDGVAPGNDLEAYRSFHQANFNCFAAVLCKTRSGEKFFQVLFHDTVWDKIVDDTKQYKLYIQPLERHQSTKRHTLPAGASETELSLSQFTAPVATFFTRTLSDNPRAYMLEETRIIINCKDKFKSSADTLTPQLLRMVATTPYEHEGKKLLNGLHVNTLKTIAYWAEENKKKKALTQQEITHLNTTITLYIHTCVYHKHRSSVFKALMQTFNEVLKLYADGVQVQWDIFDGYLKETSNEPACLELLTILSKNSVYIEQLAPTILKMMESKQILAKKLSNTATLLGLALAACHDSSVTTVNLSRLWKVLDRMRTGNDSKIQDYVKVLFYMQNGCKLCCNESNFR